MNHKGLDRIESDLRDGKHSISFALAAAYVLGKRDGELPPDPPSACGCNCCGGCADNGVVATLKGRLAYIRRELDAMDARQVARLHISVRYLIGRVRDAATRPLTRDMGFPCSPSNHYDPAGNEPEIGSRDDG
jgi:hypothetical protein